MGIKNTLARTMTWFLSKVSQTTTHAPDDGRETDPELKALCRRVAAEGCVLLKNEGILPIARDERVSLFGRGQTDYFFVGYGSGGDVKAPYRVNPAHALEEGGVLLNADLLETYREWSARHPPYEGFWGHWPTCFEEMPVSAALAKEAAKVSDLALVFIGRSAGEDRENKRTRGSWYLTKEEDRILKNVSEAFEKVCVVLNCGSVIDLSFAEKYGIGALLVSWQGGQESGNGLCDVLTGKVSPCGKLPDTVVPLDAYPSSGCFGNKRFSEYREDIYVGYRYFETFEKDRVEYPFGFGLSYTSFETVAVSVGCRGTEILVRAQTTNTGTSTGREVAQLYIKVPQGKLGAPARQLARFRKTRLLAPGETERYVLAFDLSDFASYDDSGITGHRNAFVLEPGEYAFYLGSDVRSAAKIGEVTLDGLVTVKETSSACAPQKHFERMALRDGRKVFEPVPLRSYSLKERILSSLPEGTEQTGDLGWKLADVKAGKISLDTFAAQLSDDELEAVSRGALEGMWAEHGAPGNAGILGGTSETLRQKGIPALSAHDGPSGVRINAHSTMLPIGTMLSATFDEDLVESLMRETAKELKGLSGHVLLAPGMNIHRNPLCGRSFEYFSEDPYLTGKIAAAYVRGMQSAGASAVVKHFACNSQETGRLVNDSMVSERALREIYLKGFELCIREAKPDFVMSSYNRVNGVYSCYNYDLCTQILRNEWGFKGAVMTDWWIVLETSPDFPEVSGQAYRVRAQVDVFMPGSAKTGKYKGKVDGTMFASLRAEGGVTRGELQRCAKNVLRICLKHMD